MKVSELFAEIGFKVDTKGLNDFSNSMKAIQGTIKNCVAGLKEFAKSAETISNALEKIRVVKTLGDKEFINRQKAETARIRAENYNTRSLARYRNARIPLLERMMDWREGRLEYSKENLAYKKSKELNGVGVSSISEGVTIGTIIGNIVAKSISGLFSHLKGWISGILSFLRDTIRAAMAYRDYRTFTGRSVNELSGLMGLTAHTTSMTPQQILKDAQGFQKQYWDMWFGKASPEAWMKLGIMPTGNGATDLKNVLNAIYNLTGRGENTGLALHQLGSFGLDEQYLNIFKAMRDGKEEEFVIMQNEIDNLEKASKELNSFRMSIEKVNQTIISVLLESGLDIILKSISDTLRGAASIATTKEFQESSLFGKLLMLLGAPPMDEKEAAATRKYGEPMTKKLSWWEKTKATMAAIGALPGELLFLRGYDFGDIMKREAKNAVGGYYERVSIINNIQVRDGKEAVETATELNKNQTQMNTAGATVGTI